jgi:acetyl-CoA carboxylase biotin carboxyl carrier protein
MEEFGLSEAELSGPDWKIAFRKAGKVPQATSNTDAPAENGDDGLSVAVPPASTSPAGPRGTPVNSPMNGIYYTSPSPSAPPFVTEGEAVMAGQVVGLIEAMKVFNEIVAPMSGTVEKIVAEHGQLVQPGDPLIFIA